MTPRPATADAERAARIAEALQKLAERTSELSLKRLLLAAGCGAIDAALKLHNPPEPA